MDPALLVLVRFATDGVNVTDEVIDAVQREGTCWMSGTEWEGEPAMWISVCNWRTTEDDIRRPARAILAERAPWHRRRVRALERGYEEVA